MWYAGIDWADDHHDVAVVDENGRIVGRIRVAHSVEGLEQVIGFLHEVAAGDPLNQVACIVETNHGLLITRLLEAGLPIYPVNPKTLERRRTPAGAKTDALDAYLLAKKGRSDFTELRRLAPDGPLVQELKQLTRDQDMLIQSQTRLVNQLIACLKAYYPVAVSLFAKLHQPTTLAFLQRYPTPAAARAASLDELVAFLKGQPHYPGAVAASQRIWARLPPPQLCADPITVGTKSRLMLALVEQLVALVAAIAAYDAAIAAYDAAIAAYDAAIRSLFVQPADAALFAGLPGTGKRLGPRLLAEWGDDRTRYVDAGAWMALAGTAPVPYASGKYARARRRYACIKPLRNALYQFAWQSTVQEAWTLAYYQRKRREGKSHTVALRALANHWVRIVYALWRTRTP
jgi:transposase